MSMIQQMVHKCSCPALEHSDGFFSGSTELSLIGLQSSSLQIMVCVTFDPNLETVFSEKSWKRNISAGLFKNLVKYSMYWTWVITLCVLVKVKFTTSHVWLFRGALWLGKPGAGEKGQVWISKLWAKGNIFSVYYDLACIISLVMLEGTQQSARFSCIRKAGEGCAGPTTLDFPHRLLPAPPGSRLCGWRLLGRPRRSSDFSGSGWFCLGGLLFFPCFSIFTSSVFLSLG